MEEISQTFDEQKWNNKSLNKAGVDIKSSSQVALCGHQLL